MKGQALAVVSVTYLILVEWDLSKDLPNKDSLLIEVSTPQKMYFNSVSHKGRASAGVIFVTSNR